MKLPLLLALALALSACEKIISTPDPTPPPATPAAVAAGKPVSPAPKPGAWMNDAKSGLDRSGKLGDKPKK